MTVPLQQAVAVGIYLLRKKIAGQKRFPLVLMLEPLFRCNLACAGCGKTQYSHEALNKYLTPEQCFAAAEECGAPVVSIAGGEPLIHPQIDIIVKGLIAAKKYVYLCTNALLLKRKMDLFAPGNYLTFNVHLDGIKARHEASVQREGVYDTAIEAIGVAKACGFQVTTNSTIYGEHAPEDLHAFFDAMMELQVDGMTISPGYRYEKAPVQNIFLMREQTRSYFRKVLAPMREGKKDWAFAHSPFYLDFLEGKIDYSCTPWGNPNYNIFGWQRPCYLFSEGEYAKTYKDLMENTDWNKYGAGRHPNCTDCMVHCGYEPSAVHDSLSSMKNLIRSIRSAI